MYYMYKLFFLKHNNNHLPRPELIGPGLLCDYGKVVLSNERNKSKGIN